MEKESDILKSKIELISQEFLKKIKNKRIQIISHFDTDGITSAAIIIQALKRLDQEFSLKIVKSLDKEIINSLDKEKITLFLDLASGNLKDLEESGIKEIFIIDHHEITDKIPENISIINPELWEKQKISGAGLTYLFCKEIDEKNKEFAKLAVLGMIGDTLEKEIEKLNNGILEDSNVQRKTGVLIYPSTRPLNRTLEYSSDPFIPGVTGNIQGVLELLREIGLSPVNGKYKSLIDLTEKEMQKLVTAIVLRNPEKKHKDLIGNLYLLNFFGKIEDARELSAKINACSRDNNSHIALGFCLENPRIKKKADSIHLKYRAKLLESIRFAQEQEKIEGQGYAILNAKDKIPDTMIGTITSIIAISRQYEKGTIIIGMAYDGNKIKISARNSGRKGRNVREALLSVMNNFEGEVGAHQFAAGCRINKKDEETFLETLKKHLELQVVKI
jgi:RecJ-like exonuclease